MEEIHQEKVSLQQEAETLTATLRAKMKVENELKIEQKGMVRSIEDNKGRIRGVQREV
jgi:hypothetical protein